MTNPTKLAEIKDYVQYWETPSFHKTPLTFYHCEAIGQIKYLIARVEKLEEALKFYADETNYEINVYADECHGQICEDIGERARKALEENE